MSWALFYQLMLKKRARKDTESCDSQVMANNCMHFDTQPKHSPVYREKYAAVLSVLIRGFENRFQGCQKKKKSSIYICDSIFSRNKYTTCKFSNEMYRFAIRYSTQKCDHVSLQDFHKTSLSREWYAPLCKQPYSCHHFLAVCISVNNYCQELLSSPGRVVFHQKSLMNALRTH